MSYLRSRGLTWAVAAVKATTARDVYLLVTQLAALIMQASIDYIYRGTAQVVPRTPLGFQGGVGPLAGWVSANIPG